jgi:ribosome-associated protein
MPNSQSFTIPDDELHIEFIRSSGPGGQNVNKVSTAVQLRFDALHSPTLTEPIRKRLFQIAGRRKTSEGVIVITARQFRTQEKNRLDAIQRLQKLVERAMHTPVLRRPTKPTRTSRERRIESKKRISRKKQDRRRPF